MNEKEFAKEKNVSLQTVKRWTSEGRNYLGDLKKDENGDYIIPADMPLPFSTNRKVTKASTLLTQLVEASNKGRSVNRNMYPRMDEEVFYSTIQIAVSSGLVKIKIPYKGVNKLLPTAEGLAYLKANKISKEKIYEMIIAGFTATAAVAETIKCFCGPAA